MLSCQGTEIEGNWDFKKEPVEQVFFFTFISFSFQLLAHIL